MQQSRVVTKRRWLMLLGAAALAVAMLAATLPHEHDDFAKPCASCHILFAGAVLAAAWAIHATLRAAALRPFAAPRAQASFLLRSSPFRAPPAA